MNDKLKISIVTLLLMIGLFACTQNENKQSLINKKDSDNSLVYQKDESWHKDFRVIKFGKYEQDNNTANGKEDIEWLILESNDNVATLISKYVLDAQVFDDNVDVDLKKFNQNWAGSSLRKWLNDEFYDQTFSDEEKKFIIDSEVKNTPVIGNNNSAEPVDMGPDTVDKVYILSKSEIRKYFGFEENGKSENYQALPSNFAKSKLYEDINKEDIAVWHKEQEYESENEKYSEYWVRSNVVITTMNANEFCTDIVDKNGHLSNHSFPYYVYKKEKTKHETKESNRFYKRGVRPVIKIFADLDRIKEEKEAVLEEKKANVYDIKEIDKAYQVKNYAINKTYNDFDTVVLGTYEQDGDITNGKEGIEWLVLQRENGNALLLSKYILDYVEYSNIIGRATVWKDSRIRAWCNNEFYKSAFNEKEKVLISTAKIKNYDNPVYGSSSGPETIDKVFIPSIDDLMDGFSIDYDKCIKEPFYDQKKIDDERLKTVYTDYALKKYRKERNNVNAYIQPDFWLRNQGRIGEVVNGKNNNAMTARQTIDIKGMPYDYFQYSNASDRTISKNPKLGFRPAIWVNLNLINDFDGFSFDKRVDKIYSHEEEKSEKYSYDDIDKARVVTSYNNKSNVDSYDIVTFGKYEQDNNMSNGKEDIEWIVLDKKGNEYLLFSKYALDYVQFNKTKETGKLMSWNNSDIRNFANNTFYENAFNDSEKSNILLVANDNTVNDYYNLGPTEDKVFLLSIDEIIKYFGFRNDEYDGKDEKDLILANSKNVTYATQYAKDKGVVISSTEVYENKNRYSCEYYIRSMANRSNNQVLYIRNNGALHYMNVYDNWKRIGFRPAIWVKK